MILDSSVIFQFIVAASMLAVGAYYDLKTREVSNDVWLTGGVVGLVFALGLYWGQELLLFIFLIPVFLVAIGGFVAWTRGFIGAADIKAMIAVAVILSYFSFLSIFMAILIATFYAAAVVVHNGFKEKIKNIQAPFIPFFLGGLVGSLMILLWL